MHIKPLFCACMIVLVILDNHQYLHAQCSATAFSGGTVFSSDNSIGNIAFNNTSNASSSNNSYATAAATLSLFDGNTQYLKASGFGFAIPLNASICGIQVEVERSATNVVALVTSVTDNSVRLVKNGVITGDDLAKNSEWDGTDTYIQYGSSSNLWGTAWMPTDINSANFGVVFSASIDGLLSLLPAVRIDHVRVQVYYQVLVPVHFSDMNLQLINNYPVLNCKIEYTEQLEYINLERSADQLKWITVDQLKHFSASTACRWEDSGADAGQYYYRLKAMNIAGNFWISPVKKMNLTGRSLVFNNPFGNELIIKPSAGTHEITLYDLRGTCVLNRIYSRGPGTLSVAVGFLPKGIYLLDIDRKRRLVVKK